MSLLWPLKSRSGELSFAVRNGTHVHHCVCSPGNCVRLLCCHKGEGEEQERGWETRAPSHHSPIASSARQLAGPRHGASGHWRRRAPRSAQQPGGMLEMSCAERLILKEGRRVCPVRKASMKHAAASTLTCPPSHIPQACLSHQVAFPWCGPGRACGLLQILALLQLCCTEVEFLLF